MQWNCSMPGRACQASRQEFRTSFFNAVIPFRCRKTVPLRISPPVLSRCSIPLLIRILQHACIGS